ncbi:hypothetical protein [Actinomadura sp. 9N215]|uniref:hypothetical protein n=1 Tax=Actinomadura sp. 9N215 TaxID=3375150 RepID=UPI00378BCE87
MIRAESFAGRLVASLARPRPEPAGRRPAPGLIGALARDAAGEAPPRRPRTRPAPRTGPGPRVPAPRDGSRPPLKGFGKPLLSAFLAAAAMAGGVLVDTAIQEPRPMVAPGGGFMRVTDESGRITVSVPAEWRVWPGPTWDPSTVGVRDGRQRPVLRATPDLRGFLGDGSAPGIFVGLVSAASDDELPPPAASGHPSCGPPRARPYLAAGGLLHGSIRRFTGCRSGTPSVDEIGLSGTGLSGDGVRAWVRIKQRDDRDLTLEILGTLRITGA